ncbi:MAG: DUF1501 domain-containing protein [Pirellulales bacterium]
MLHHWSATTGGSFQSGAIDEQTYPHFGGWVVRVRGDPPFCAVQPWRDGVCGGLQTGQVIGATDYLGKSIVERPVSVPALHTTIYATLGIDPHKELFDGGRPVPITDGGKVITELFS